MIEKELVTDVRWEHSMGSSELVLVTEKAEYVLDFWYPDERRCHMDDSRALALIGQRIDVQGLKQEIHERDVRYIQSWV